MSDMFIKGFQRNWKLIDQVRKKHYSHVFKSESDFTPDSREIYYAKFYTELYMDYIKLKTKKSYIDEL